MATAINCLLTTGQSPDYPDHLNDSIQVSNRLSLVFSLFIGIPFTFLTFTNIPELTIIPFLGLLSFLSVVVLNGLGAVRFSRWFISVAPAVLIATYQAAVLQEGEPPASYFLMIQISFLIITFVVHSWEEKKTIAVLCAINVIIFYLQNPLNSWLEVDLDADLTIWNSGIYYYGSLSVAFVCLIGETTALVLRSHQEKLKFRKILSESKEQREQLKNSEEELKERLEQLKVAQEEEKIRQWVNEGQTRINDILRSKKEASEIYDDFLSYIIKYIKANQGGIFVSGENESDDPMKTPLHLVAAYAYNKKKYLTKEVLAGDTLMGQSFLEGVPYRLSEIPNDYLEITSGLGESNPKNIAIMPIIDDEKVEGVLELAKFDEITEADMQFLESACENLASFVFSQRWEIESKRMLEDSQQQAERFMVKEEEMQEREQRHLDQINDLKRQIEQLEKQTAG